MYNEHQKTPCNLGQDEPPLRMGSQRFKLFLILASLLSRVGVVLMFGETDLDTGEVTGVFSSPSCVMLPRISSLTSWQFQGLVSTISLL
jgi:hypothetical protein